MFPVITWPELTSTGRGKRQRIWYQWVRGWVGPVDSHTVSLCGWGTHKRDSTIKRFIFYKDVVGLGELVKDTYWEPQKATSNQKASPCIIPVDQRVKDRGMEILAGEGGYG